MTYLVLARTYCRRSNPFAGEFGRNETHLMSVICAVCSTKLLIEWDSCFDESICSNMDRISKELNPDNTDSKLWCSFSWFDSYFANTFLPNLRMGMAVGGPPHFQPEWFSNEYLQIKNRHSPFALTDNVWNLFQCDVFRSSTSARM